MNVFRKLLSATSITQILFPLSCTNPIGSDQNQNLQWNFTETVLTK